MIEVGEYIRTKSGYIGDVVNINEFRPPEAEICVDMNFSDYVFVGEKDITKHSKNIIDLIKVGDYVNGFRVTGITSNYVYLDKFNVETGRIKKIADYQVETILTHKQYEQNCYKVGDIE